MTIAKLFALHEDAKKKWQLKNSFRYAQREKEKSISAKRCAFHPNKVNGCCL